MGWDNEHGVGHMWPPKDSPVAGATRYGHGLTKRRTMEKTGGERDYGDIFLAKMELMS